MRSGGRPARLLQIDVGFGVILAADVGETHARLALTDLSPRVLAEARLAVDLRSDPPVLLELLLSRFRTLLTGAGRTMHEVLGICLGLPAPVDYFGARVTGPSIMPRWDDFDIAGWFSARPTLRS